MHLRIGGSVVIRYPVSVTERFRVGRACVGATFRLCVHGFLFLSSPSFGRWCRPVGFVLKQRIAAGEITVKHVPDDSMPADFLTKWIGAKKLETSIEFATHASARVRS